MIKFNLSYKSELLKICKFGVVGLINTAITISIIFFFTKILGVNYVLANILGYSAGIINSYLMNKYWTFRSPGSHQIQILKFLIIVGISYGIQVVFLIFMVEVFLLNKDIAQMIGMIIYTGVNYLGNRIFTFKKES